MKKKAVKTKPIKPMRYEAPGTAHGSQCPTCKALALKGAQKAEGL